MKEPAGGRAAPRIVLVGAGHAHLHLVRRAAQLARTGARVTLVDPGTFTYSGTSTGTLAGQYATGFGCLDVEPLAASCGVRLIKDRVVGREEPDRLALGSGGSVPYDLASFNVGSEVPLEGIPGAAEHALPVKPVSNLIAIRRSLEEKWAAGGRTVRVVVAGSGASACEVAAGVDGLAWRRGAPVEVTLVAGSSGLLPEHPPHAGAHLERLLVARGVRVLKGRRMTGSEPVSALLDDGGRLPADLQVMATGLRPPALIRELGLGETGLEVGPDLCCVHDPRVFGAGDCLAFLPRPLPRLGVFSVREARVLLHNLSARILGAPLRPYRPQKRWLSILNLGRGDALALRGRWSWTGRSSLHLKHLLDSRFLARHRRPC